MKYLDTPCTRCNKKRVIPPLKKDLDKPLILVECDFCNKKSRYNVVSHIDREDGYWLSKWGRGIDGDLVLVKRRIARRHKRLTSAQIRFALDKIYGDAV